MEKQRGFDNLLANPSADSDLTGIFANRTSTTLSRVLVDGDYRVRAVNGGTQTYEGVRSESAAGLGLSGARHLVGVVDVTGGGTLDVVLVRARYTDGTYTDATRAPSVTLSGTAWARIVVPRLVSTAAKIVDKVELHVVHSAAGASFTFYADNAKVIEL